MAMSIGASPARFSVVYVSRSYMPWICLCISYPSHFVLVIWNTYAMNQPCTPSLLRRARNYSERLEYYCGFLIMLCAVLIWWRTSTAVTAQQLRANIAALSVYCGERPSLDTILPTWR